MEVNRLPKQVLYSELPNAPRPTGCPKLRFRDVLKRDLNAFSKQILHGENSPAIKESGSQPLKLENNIQTIIPGGL